MDKNKLVLPITILLASIILGGFYYVDYLNKQQAEVFSNNLRCQNLLKDLKQKWDNIFGIYYSKELNTCVVKYTTIPSLSKFIEGNPSVMGKSKTPILKNGTMVEASIETMEGF
ncbi:MAG: hypothetical protein V1732_02705 [Patescibacteria group bacterium]